MSATWDALVAAAEARPALRLLDDEALGTVLGALNKHFVDDVARPFWWTRLRTDASRLPYEETAFLRVLSSLMTDDAECILLVAEDSPRQAGALAGPFGELVEALMASPGFEFAITTKALDTLVLDTHHNELIVVPAVR